MIYGLMNDGVMCRSVSAHRVIRRRCAKWDVGDCGRIGNISPSTYQRTDWKKGGLKRKADDGCWSWGGRRREKERERSRCGEKKAASIIYQPGVRVDGGIGKGWREEWWRWNDSRGREGGRQEVRIEKLEWLSRTLFPLLARYPRLLSFPSFLSSYNHSISRPPFLLRSQTEAKHRKDERKTAKLI